jgi:hypothetical protein
MVLHQMCGLIALVVDYVFRNSSVILGAVSYDRRLFEQEPGVFFPL